MFSFHHVLEHILLYKMCVCMRLHLPSKKNSRDRFALIFIFIVFFFTKFEILTIFFSNLAYNIQLKEQVHTRHIT